MSPRGVPGSRSPHGTITRYFNQGCRCDECRRNATAYLRKRRGQKTWTEYLASIKPDHGTESRYNGGCRCEQCKRASRLARARRRAAERAA